MIGSLGVPAGSYVLFAKARFYHSESPNLSCHLDAGSDTDQSRVNNALGGGSSYTQFSLLLTHVFATAGSVTLSCYAGNATTNELTRIAAVKVGSLSG